MDKQSISARLSKTLRTLVSQQALSHAELAKRSNLSAGMVNKIINGKVSITIPTLYNLASGLGVSINTLLNGIDTPKTQRKYTNKRKEACYFCGILSVGGKRICHVQDSTGKTIGVSELENSITLTHSPTQLVQRIKESIRAATQHTHIDAKTISIAIVAHCYELEEALEKFTMAAQKHFHTVIVLADWQATYFAAFKNKPGISLVADKGVSVSYLHNDQLQKFGGWGFPIYDLGGEHWLGMMAVRHTIEVYEGFAKPSLLSNSILNQYNGKIETLIDVCLRNKGNYDIYCTFTHKLIETYYTENKSAKSLIQLGFKHIYRYIDRIDAIFQKANKISVNGSLAHIYREFIPRDRLAHSIQDPIKVELLCDIAKHPTKVKHAGIRGM